MKFFYLMMVLVTTFYASPEEVKKVDHVANAVPKTMSVENKKKRFYHLLVPIVDKVYSELMEQYVSVSDDIEEGKNPKKIAQLKKLYNVKSDSELLRALKPHPQSIVLAQAALESAWGTSRFFREANNVFGMWSKNKNEKRIAANIKRKGNQTIWLRKFDSLEDSVRAYYFLLAKAKAFKDFRVVRYDTDDVHQMVQKLHKYSEIGQNYTKALSKMIKHNELTKYDYQYKYNAENAVAFTKNLDQLYNLE